MSKHAPHLSALAIGLILALYARAYGNDPAVPDEPAAAESGEAPDYNQPTEIGVRFTPALADAISHQFTKSMQERYELDEEQTTQIRELMARQFMELAHKNAENGRNMVESFMAALIKNDGQIPKDVAKELAKTAQPMMPALREFFTNSSAEIGRRMTIKQRLKFIGDVAVATAGLAIFESRLKRWEAGDAGEFVTLDDREEDDNAQSEPEDPNEPQAHRQARRQANRQMRWNADIDGRWDDYVKNASEYYGFDDKQLAAAEAILKDLQDRAAAYKTKDWRDKLREIWIADSLTGRLDSKFNRGPWKYQLDNERERLMKPLEDMGEELKRRIEAIPTSKQRSEALARARDALKEKGMKRMPV